MPVVDKGLNSFSEYVREQIENHPAGVSTGLQGSHAPILQEKREIAQQVLEVFSLVHQVK